MPVTLVTHPHKFDKGIIREKLIKFLKSSGMKAYFLRDGEKKAYGEKLYTGELRPSDKLGKYGRASLKDEDANKIVEQNTRIFLAGGYLSECVGSTYNSILRASERLSSEVEVIFLSDIIYLKKKSGKPALLTELLERGAEEDLRNYFRSFRESERIDHQFLRINQVISSSRSGRSAV